MDDVTAPERVRSYTAHRAAVALGHMIKGNTEAAEEWLARIPRSERGRVNAALEDLSIQLSRLGRRVDG